MKRCPICNANYPASYNYCPEDGTQVRPRDERSERHCPSCRAEIAEDQQAFCTGCGTDVRSPQSAAGPPGAQQSARPKPAPQLRPALKKGAFAGVVTPFRKTIYDALVQDLSRIDPDKRPWFGMEVGADLLAVCPQAIIVAKIIDPRGIEKAFVHSSLDPLQSWLITKPDGSDHPLENPVPKTLQAIRSVRTTFGPYLESRARVSDFRLKGLVVFPDEYEVGRVKQQVNYDTATTVMRIINARELPEEVLKPVQRQRINPERCREWLRATVLKGAENGFTAGTWLDPDAAGISKRAHVTGGQGSIAHRGTIPDASQPSAGTPRPPSLPKVGRIVARTAGLSLVLAVAVLISLWQLDRLQPLIFYGHSPAREDAPVRAVPLEQSQSRETTQPEGSNGSTRPSPAVREHSPTHPGTDAVESHGLGPTDGEGNGEDQARLPVEVRRKAIEDRIHAAIRNRAVGGVKVSFVDDTAYLAGEVLSHNQKAAAERAARAIPEVKRVRSSISVMWNRG